MVIFNVKPGGRDNYKIWEEGQIPSVIFEITSPSTRKNDENFKKQLYAQLGVQEYWQFDSKGQWIPEQLRGYRLHIFTTFNGETECVYEPITDGQSQPLQLRLTAEGRLIGFYRLDTGEKLLVPDELAVARQQAEERAAELEAQLDRYRQQFGELPEG